MTGHSKPTAPKVMSAFSLQEMGDRARLEQFTFILVEDEPMAWVIMFSASAASSHYGGRSESLSNSAEGHKAGQGMESNSGLLGFTPGSSPSDASEATVQGG